MPSSMALTLRANILAQQWATGLGKGVSASDPDIRIPGTQAWKYQAAIRTAKVSIFTDCQSARPGCRDRLICRPIDMFR